MLEAGVTGLEIAERLEITKQAVSQVITGRSTSRRVQEAIAEACGVPLDDLFPPELNAAAA
ncbi:helix-turn-helix transcriptional regulator [Gemmatimonas sp.]|jgi:transcriptional regulator with XRE-family HTH domain|uniref:helix-turn-helix transcriptional regulator n=1 Tax=Gemmatimonas sp. TaxID=1962908 RepID=UPI0037C0F038